jgi:hopanoid-associated phosphorylase
MSVLVVTGVAREARSASGAGIETICSGGSPANLRRLLMKEAYPDITAVISFGIAGGLNPALIPGHVIAADAVVSQVHRWPTNPDITDAMVAELQAAGLSVLRASIVGVDEALLDPQAKAISRQRTGGAIVDMESHIAAEYAAERKLPFAALRVVCDPSERSLPPLVNQALTPEGKVDYKGVFSSLMRQPGQVSDLFRLMFDSQTAFGALETAGKAMRAALARPSSLH